MEDLESLIAGDAYSCFGEGFAATASHMRTPSIPGGRLRLFDTVAEFDPNGGPWGRGYLRAVGEVRPDAWFYASHFHNDPCMPATLVAEGAVHAAGFLMLAMGFGIHRDGWRFEPVPGMRQTFVCRGQVTPDGPHLLEFEIFVKELIAEAEPTVIAAVLCKSDGLKIFLCRQLGLKLTPY